MRRFLRAAALEIQGRIVADADVDPERQVAEAPAASTIASGNADRLARTVSQIFNMRVNIGALSCNG